MDTFPSSSLKNARNDIHASVAPSSPKAIALIPIVYMTAQKNGNRASNVFSVDRKMTSVWIPYLSAIIQNPTAYTFHVWHKGEKVATIKRWKDSFLFPYSIKKEIEYQSDYYRDLRIDTASVEQLVDVRNPDLADFTMGPEDNPRPLDFEFKLTPEQMEEANRIFATVFGGDLKCMGRWVYKTKFPSLKSSFTPLDSKTLVIDGFDDKHVFVADGRMYDVEQRKNAPFDPPADLKKENIKMAGIPMNTWLLLLRPAEFQDTATACMALKKMVKEQGKVRGSEYLADYLWLSDGTQMVEARIYNTKVRVDGRWLTLPEIEALNDRKNDMWFGKWGRIRKLFV
jgi:hypothetical protein